MLRVETVDLQSIKALLEVSLLAGGLQDAVQDEVRTVIILVFFDYLLELVPETFFTLYPYKRRPSNDIAFLLFLAAKQQLCYFSQTLLLLTPISLLVN